MGLSNTLVVQPHFVEIVDRFSLSCAKDSVASIT